MATNQKRMRVHVLPSVLKQGAQGLKDFDFLVPLLWHRVPHSLTIGAVFAIMQLQSPKSKVAVIELEQSALKKLIENKDKLPGTVIPHPSVTVSDPFSLKFADLMRLPEAETEYIRASQVSGFWIDAFKSQPRTPVTGNFYTGFAAIGKVLGLTIKQVCSTQSLPSAPSLSLAGK
jgi:hypothetical protein